MTNEVDMCFDLPTGLLTSTMAQKPEVRSWSKEGPIWGAPDGCLYNFAFNTSKPPWNDVNVRLAVNYAFDRQKITDLAFEGAMPTAILPFSGYFAPQYVPGRIQADPRQVRPRHPVTGQGRRVHGQGRLREERGRVLGQGWQAARRLLQLPRLHEGDRSGPAAAAHRGRLQHDLEARSEVGLQGLPG